MRRGVLGGTFNPIHVGHLIIAEDVREALSLDQVIFVAAGRPWMKMNHELAPAEDRWEMVLRAIAGNKRFIASKVDILRAGPSFTYDTVTDLDRELGSAQETYFIAGMDTLGALPRWHRVREFLQRWRMAIVPRPGVDRDALLAQLREELPEAVARIDFVDGARIDVSSTEIRQRVREGRSIAYRVPAAVERYIMERGLYRQTDR